MPITDSILATLAYYDGFEYPLSDFEIYRFLINPQRLRSNVESIDTITLREVQVGLEELLIHGQVIQELGLYSLKDRIGLAEKRLDSEKIAAQKWRRCLRLAYWFQIAPWLRGMFVSGSLAMGTVNSESDFDMLVIVEPGRLYLARLFLSGLASLMRARRTRYDTSAPDKFCFNHFITGNALTIRHESLYNAQTYAHLYSLDLNSLPGEFFAANLWINKFVFNFTPHQKTIRRSIRRSAGLLSLAVFIEKIFSGWLGDLLEGFARSYQQRRIASNPTTTAPGGRIVFNDTELEFHPHSFEKNILEHYNELVRKLSVSFNVELDSGLKK